RDRDLRRFDHAVRVAPVHVEGAEPFPIALERLARVAIARAPEIEPVRRLELEAFAQLLLGEGLVADDVDLADLRPLALADLDLEFDLIARGLLDGRVDPHAVLPLTEVHVGEALLQAIEDRAVE